MRIMHSELEDASCIRTRCGSIKQAMALPPDSIYLADIHGLAALLTASCLLPRCMHFSFLLYNLSAEYAIYLSRSVQVTVTVKF